jgi:hypothetical protein
MKLTAGKKTEKATEKATKKLKFNVFNIKSLLVFDRKKLDKIKKEKKKFSLFEKKKKIVKDKEDKIESPRTMGSTLKNIAGMLLAKPLSIIDKLKELFGIILLGILVNNLPMIVKKLQDVLGKIQKFFEDNPWIGNVLKFTFDIIAKGMMGILDLTKTLMPIIGGSFKFALDTIKTAGNEIGKLIKFFDDLGDGISALMSSLGYKPPAKAAQAYARSKGKYYSSTTGRTYANYKTALQNPAVKKGAQQQQQAIQQKAQKAQAAPAPGYDPNKGTSVFVDRNNKPIKESPSTIMAPITRNGRTIMGAMDPNDKTGTATKVPTSWLPAQFSPQEFGRYQAVNRAQQVQKFSIGGTIKNFFGGMFGFGKQNTPPKQVAGSESPNLISKDGGKTYAGPYASPAGTAKGRKARETVNYFKFYENNVNSQNIRLKKEQNNLSMFSEFMKSYDNLSKLKKKYGDEDLNVPPGPGGTYSLPDQAISVNEKEVIGHVGSTGQSTGPHIHLEAMSKDKKIPLSLRKNIFVSGKSLTSNNYASSSPVGMRFHPIKKRMIFHAGEDWPAPTNSQITLRGGVKFVKYIEEGSDPRYDGYGNVVVIQDTDGKEYFMGHLNSGPTNLSALMKRQEEQMQQKTPGKGAEKVWNFFKSPEKGLSDIAVAGILGNAEDESTFNPKARGKRMGPDGTDALGLFQWAEKGRWLSLTSFAKKHKWDPWDLDTQLRFSWEELNSAYYQPALEGIRNAKTPEEAAEIWRKKYEVGSGGVAERKINAKKWYNTYKGKSAKTAPTVLPPLTKEQQLEKNIITEMNGSKSMTVGDKTVSVEKKDGKDVIKVTTGGLFGIGAKELQLDKNLLNNLLYEIKNKNKKVEPVKKQGGFDGSSGIKNNDSASNVILLNQETAYIVPGETQTVPVPGPTQIVPIFISQSTSNSRSIRSTLLS